MSLAAVRNRFHVWEYGAPRPVPIDPAVMSRSRHGSDLRYFCGILAHVDAALTGHGLRFLLTWNLDAFDEQFRDSVVILVGDEKHQAPSWAPAVRVIFKTGGVTADWWRSARDAPMDVAWRVALRGARNRALAARRRITACREPGRPAPMFELPLGYYRLVDVPDVPFAGRSVDVFFAGSTGPTSAFSFRPRVASRRHLAAGLKQARHDLPQLKIKHADARHALRGPALGGPHERTKPTPLALRLGPVV